MHGHMNVKYFIGIHLYTTTQSLDIVKQVKIQ